ncbi:MAG: RloB domain-containing protein, partial [Victivallaceae bacterium]|nr:RloB domain-containing protein [Victivallaceae bacterium]
KRLYRKSLRHASISGIPYDEIWIIFDKDDFDCFEDAVAICESEKNSYAGFSNECFELWLILHFEEIKSGMNRKKLSSKVKHFVNKNSSKTYSERDLKRNIYISDVLDMIEDNGSRKDAIIRAKELQGDLSDKEHCLNNPSTSIYKLVEKLEKYISS